MESATDEEVAAFLTKYGITKNLLPLIHVTDPAVLHLKVAVGNVIKAMRKSPVTNETEPYYRLVVE